MPRVLLFGHLHSFVSHFGGPFIYRCVEMHSFIADECAVVEGRALGQHLYLVMVSSFKLIHSLASLKYAKVRAAVAKTKTKTSRATPVARGKREGVGELQADNGDGGVALRGCLRSAVVARGSRRANEGRLRRRQKRGLCHPRRLHANWLKCEFM